MSRRGMPDFSGVARDLVAAARDAEFDVTSDQGTVSDAWACRLAGLAHRVKATKSLARKLRDDYERATSMGIPEDHARDVLRYTFIIRTGTYARDGRRILRGLAEFGYRLRDFRNFWRRGEPYRGVNTNLETPEGDDLEVQFHTEVSWTMKQANHPLYEERRHPGTSPERADELERSMASRWRDVRTPSGASEWRE